MTDITENQQILALAIGMVLLMVVLTSIIVWQQLRIRKLSQPKYGFLGKSLPALITAIVLGAGLIGGVYLTNQEDTTFETSASKNIGVEYTRREIVDNGNRAVYELKAIPSLDGIVYGPDKQAVFDVYWTVDGPEHIEKSEQSVSQVNPSSIEVDLQRGSYDIIVLVSYTDPETGKKSNNTLKETVIF